MSEYALILGGIALVCVVAVMFLGDRISDLFDRTAKPIGPVASQPASPATPYPMSLADCEDGGWARFSQFSSEAACNDFVNGIPP
jgi:Flp pilus assembly pilin Flp